MQSVLVATTAYYTARVACEWSVWNAFKLVYMECCTAAAARHPPNVRDNVVAPSVENAVQQVEHSAEHTLLLEILSWSYVAKRNYHVRRMWSVLFAVAIQSWGVLKLHDHRRPPSPYN